MKLLNWADVALGVCLVALPFGLRTSGRALLLTEQIPGLILILTAAWVLLIGRNRLRVTWLQELDALWLIVGSFALLFGGRPRAAAVVVLSGLLVLLLNLIGTYKMTRQPNQIA